MTQPASVVDGTVGQQHHHAAALQRLSGASVLSWGRRHSRALQVVGAALIYFAYTARLTWPAVIHIDHYWLISIGDAYGDLATYRTMVTEGLNPFLPGTMHLLAGPEGLPVSWAANLASAPNVLLQYTLMAIFGQVAAFTTYQFIGYVFTGAMTFVLIRRLTGNAWIALLFGWAYAFYPVTYLDAVGHIDFLYEGFLSLSLWRLLELHWRPTRRNAVLAGAAVCLSMWWTPYFILIGGFFYLAVLIASLVLAGHSKQLRQIVRFQGITAVVVVVFLVALAALSLAPQGGSVGVRSNTLAALIVYGARPLEYLLPDAGQQLLGGLTGPYLASHLYGSDAAEATLYLGETVIALTLIAVWFTVRRRLPPRINSAAMVIFFAGLVALICSAPAEVHLGGVMIPFPSFFVAKITSTWRVYSRFVFAVMLAAVCLAAIGTDALARRLGTRGRVILLLAVTVLVPVDLSYSLFADSTAGRIDPAVKALSKQPRGLTAEYPLVPAADDLYTDIFYQSQDGMPTINGYAQGSLQERRALTLYYLSEPTTASRLAALGVKYVLNDVGTPPPYGQPSPGQPGPGFKLLYKGVSPKGPPMPASFGPTYDLYKVTAKPSGPGLVTFDKGFDPTFEPLGNSSDNWTWLEQRTGTIELAGQCTSCAGVLTMRLQSFGRPREVTIRRGSTVLFRGSVTAPEVVAIPTRFPANHEISITTSPGPQPISPGGGSDTRTVSVEISELAFDWPTGRPQVVTTTDSPS